MGRPVLVAIVVALVVAISAGAGLADYETGSESSSAYLVQPGDTLWGIASTHHLTVAQLASYNGIDPAAILPIGRKLAFPGSSPSGARPAGATASAAGFCSTLDGGGGPWGVLPAQLAASPARLALRPLFDLWAAHYGISAPLLEAITWQESGWQQGVVSSAGAVGVGQLMPGTAAFVQTAIVGQPLSIWSTSDNIRMAAAFVAYLAHIEGNNRCYTIAAYYEGPVNLAAAGVYPDTQLYVSDVEALLPRFS
jgi:murein DD-endopeptidase MepM/ murein hydrolase activator NlpD